MALALALLAAAYLVGANVFLLPSIGPHVISRKPEKLTVSWQRAWSLWPGSVRARGLTVSGENLVNQWYVALDHARLRVSLLGLADKSVLVRSIEGSGLDVRLRPQAFDAELSVDERQLSVDALGAQRGYPEIPGRRLPASREAVEPSPGGAKPWTVELEVDGVTGLHQLHSGAERATGDIDLAGRARFVLQKRYLDIEVERLRLESARLESRGELLAEDLEVSIEGRLGPFEPAAVNGRDVFKELDSSTALAGKVTNLSALRHLLPERARVDVEGSGDLEVAIEVASGVVQSGSTLALSSGVVSVEFLGYAGMGRGEVMAATLADDGGTAVCARLSDYEIDRTGAQRGPAGSASRPLLHSSPESSDALWVSATSDRPTTSLSGATDTRPPRVVAVGRRSTTSIAWRAFLPKLPELSHLGGARGTLGGRF